MLHITNGDSAATTLRASGLPGEVLPWRDVLHEGPVPAGLELAALSEARARFLADAGLGGDNDDVLADFRRRDATLAGFAGHAEVTLWFEHDLYDQLQLLQLLDWFAGRDLGATRLRLICIGSFPGRPRFGGLGELTAVELASLSPVRHAVTAGELRLARAAWAAFRAPDPAGLVTLLDDDTAAMPFLRAALLRHLEEFPSTENGLSRTERELLEVLAAGGGTPHNIFAAWQAKEEAPFMGDTPLWIHLRQLGAGPHPLIALVGGGGFKAPRECTGPDAFAAQRLVITEVGRDVLAGAADHLELNGINRWLGGVHLQVGAPLWRWQAQPRQLIPATRNQA
jgi:hypothetical protein